MDKEYNKIVTNVSCHENKITNALLAFFMGGVYGLVGQVLFALIKNQFGYADSVCFTIVFIIFVTIASVLTGLGVFDKVAMFFKAGIIIPASGFSHAMTSSAMDNNKEGFVTGIGANIFKLTGSIILYGIVSAILFAFIKGVLI